MSDPPETPAGPEGVPAAIFHEAYQGRAPWDTGRPQPTVLEMIARGLFVGDVLDLGCGTGDNSLQIARAGHRTLGVDLVPRAVELAREKADARGVSGAGFVVADALDLDLPRRFETVLDAAVFHVFSDHDRLRYAGSVGRVLRTGGCLHLLVFTEHQPGGGPRRVSRQEIRDTFSSGGWSVESIVPSSYDTNSGTKQSWHATIRRDG